MPGTILSTGDAVVNKMDKIPALLVTILKQSQETVYITELKQTKREKQ